MCVVRNKDRQAQIGDNKGEQKKKQTKENKTKKCRPSQVPISRVWPATRTERLSPPTPPHIRLSSPIPL